MRSTFVKIGEIFADNVVEVLMAAADEMIQRQCGIYLYPGKACRKPACGGLGKILTWGLKRCPKAAGICPAQVTCDWSAVNPPAEIP